MHIKNLTLSFGTQIIYDNAELSLGRRDHAGIVGVNGAGKSTLLNILIGRITPDAGKIDTGGARMGYLPQVIEIATPDLTVWDYLLTGRPIEELNHRLQELYIKLADVPDDKNIADEIATTQHELDYYDVYNAEDALLTLIENMEIDASWMDMRLCDLSGGQKSKVAFTRLLYSMPDIMLLDEPTNHLDAGTRDFVTKYMQRYRDRKSTRLNSSHIH